MSFSRLIFGSFRGCLAISISSLIPLLAGSIAPCPAEEAQPAAEDVQ